VRQGPLAPRQQSVRRGGEGRLRPRQHRLEGYSTMGAAGPMSAATAGCWGGGGVRGLGRHGFDARSHGPPAPFFRLAEGTANTRFTLIIQLDSGTLVSHLPSFRQVTATPHRRHLYATSTPLVRNHHLATADLTLLECPITARYKFRWPTRIGLRDRVSAS